MFPGARVAVLCWKDPEAKFIALSHAQMEKPRWDHTAKITEGLPCAWPISSPGGHQWVRPDDKQQGHEHRVQRGCMTGLDRAGSDGEESGGEECSGTASLRQARVGCSDSAGPRGEAVRVWSPDS